MASVSTMSVGSTTLRWTLSALLLGFLIRPAQAATFTTRSIRQTNPLAGPSNRITVTLVADTNLAASDNSKVTLLGLNNAVATSPITLLDAGNDGESIFSDGITQSRGVWNGASGTLTLTVHSGLTLQSGTTYSFAFDCQNPTTAQSAPSISVAASGTSSFANAIMASPNTAAKGVANGANALYTIIPAFTTRSIQQSTPVTGATNKIQVTLQANCDLDATSTVTIKGLAGSATANNGALPIATSPSAHLGGSGVWTQADGKLILTSVGMAAATTYSISFDLTNPASSLSSPSVVISAVLEAGGTAIISARRHQL